MLLLLALVLLDVYYVYYYFADGFLLPRDAGSEWRRGRASGRGAAEVMEAKTR